MRKCVDVSISFAKEANQRWHKKEGRKKTHYYCNRHGPIFLPSGFEFMSNSSPKRFLSSVRQSSYLGYLSLLSLLGLLGQE